jgi:molecular chaperone GrpE
VEPQPKKVVQVKVTDKRGVPDKVADPGVPSDRIGELSDTSPGEPGQYGSDGAVSDNSLSGPTGTPGSAPGPDEHDYLDDLKRLQAEFDNFRKRTRADQASAGDRAAGRVIEELLLVLDNFERAIAHGEGGEGVQLVFKDFKAALERLGLEEVPAEGAAFDPNVHEAVESREVDGLEESSIIEVYRRGYLHKGQLLRPAMVVVGRPTEKDGR